MHLSPTNQYKFIPLSLPFLAPAKTRGHEPLTSELGEHSATMVQPLALRLLVEFELFRQGIEPEIHVRDLKCASRIFYEVWVKQCT